MEFEQRMDVDNNYNQQAQTRRTIAPMFPNAFGPPEIDPREIEQYNVLGDGSFGTVYKGKCRQKDVAVKVLIKQDYDEKTLEAFRHEVEIMSKIFHPNINLFMGACTVPGHLMIVTELMRGDLESMLLDDNVQLSLLQRLKMGKDAALGILWLHSSNPQTIHRDLKASNLLVDDNLTCKICDFGLSQFKTKGKNITDGSDGAKGTPLWMAPEVMMGEEFNEKCDVYSFGLILWFLLTQKEPYEEFDDLDHFTHAVCMKYHRPIIPPDCDPNLKNLIERCWHPIPAHRPGFSEIVQRLGHIIIDIAIEDPIGRHFWKENFLEKDTVPWLDFLNAFCRLLQILPDYRIPITEVLNNYRDLIKNTTIETDIKCLKAILAEKDKKSQSVNDNDSDYFVSIEKFGNILKWFGPLTLKPYPPDGINIIHKIRRLLQEPWFHGDVVTTDSENRLINKPEGTFLIRFSTSSPGCYTISKVSVGDCTIKHQKIQYKSGGYFEINGKSYKTLQDLVRMEAEALQLRIPCMGSRFLSLFIEQKISGYVN